MDRSRVGCLVAKERYLLTSRLDISAHKGPIDLIRAVPRFSNQQDSIGISYVDIGGDREGEGGR